MALRTKGKWILAGLALATAMSVSGGAAIAGSVGVKGHLNPLPGGSPFLYTFELDLEVGTIAPGSSLTVGTLPGFGIIGVTTGSGTQQPPTIGNPNDFWYVPPGGVVSTGQGPYGTQASVTWNFLAGTTYTNSDPTNPVIAGLFTVETAFDYPDNMPPATPLTIIDFTFHFADGTQSTGIVNFSLVPEPSSVVMLLAGVGALPLIGRWVKRSRAQRAS